MRTKFEPEGGKRAESASKRSDRQSHILRQRLLSSEVIHPTAVVQHVVGWNQLQRGNGIGEFTEFLSMTPFFPTIFSKKQIFQSIFCALVLYFYKGFYLL
ncbi:MAG: hypothetical protein P8P32_06530, partial [Akkermansiaceae bacterium]|nr:hypothetical protein [Akkermansiaceae bacterium]